MLRALTGTHDFSREATTLPRHTSWRSVRIERAPSVESLNRLLRTGWYVIAVNIDGMSFLSQHLASAPLHAMAPHRRSAVDIVLAEDGRRGSQNAVFVGRTVGGHANTDAMPTSVHGWTRTLVVELGSGDAVVLYEREASQW